jgi:hypothetical protein
MNDDTKQVVLWMSAGFTKKPPADETAAFIQIFAPCFAAVITAMPSATDAKRLREAAVASLTECNMMEEEATAIVDDMAMVGLLGTLHLQEKPLSVLVQSSVTHPALTHLKNLFGPLPDKAAPLTAAVAVLIALGVYERLPSLADMVRQTMKQL